MRILTLILTLSYFSLFCQDIDWIEYDNSIVNDTINYKDSLNKRQGYFIFYSQNDSLIEYLEGVFKEDLPIGLWKHTFVDSNYSIGAYSPKKARYSPVFGAHHSYVGGLGGKIGVWTTYSKDNKYISKKIPTYKKNIFRKKRTSTILDSLNRVIFYDEDKTIRFLRFYICDLTKEIKYYTNGNKKYKKKYYTDTHRLIDYYENGNIKKKDIYNRQMLRRFRKVKFYYLNGQIKKKERYKIKEELKKVGENSYFCTFPQFRDGKWVSYSKNGEIVSVKKYNMGEVEE